MGLIRPAPAALLGMALVVLAALAALTIMQTLQFDEIARQMQQHSARQGFRNRLDALADTLFQRLDGDNEAQHFAPRPDASWITSQIAAPLAETAGIEALLVLPEGRDRPTYAAREGVQTRHASAGGLGPVMLQVARHLRATPGLMRACSIGWSSGQLMMLCGLRVRSPGRPGSVLVMGAQALDARQLARFGLRSMVGALRVEPASPRDEHQSAAAPAIALEDIDGHAVARLTWQQRRPGADLLERLSCPLAAMALLLGALATLLTREGLRCLRASKEREHKLAHFDPLTQLPNRSYLLDQLAQVQALARRTPIEVSVLSIDLDRFQDVNDTLGHHAGDALIEAVAKMLQGMCRQSDLLARVGGDEFAVLLPHTGADGALHMAERILSTLASPVDLPCGVLRTGCSIGISCLQDAATTPAEMLRQADLALHEAKERGRGRAAFFEVEMDNALRLRRDLENDLTAALAGGALRMLYQPQVNTEGHLVGLEALVRWTHPVRGPIAPSIFVPLAEECGLIDELGAFILDRVFAETAGIAGVRVAINVSALQLRSPHFMATITRLVAQHRIDPADYEIEITETVLLGEDRVTRDNIAVLKQEGFSVALDDFGTGYSSLSSLQHFSVDKIKIDRSFVRDIDGTNAAAADTRRLVKAVIDLARAMDLGVIAEGVETSSQHQRLIEAGCQRFQGYLFGHPMPYADAMQIMPVAA